MIYTSQPPSMAYGYASPASPWWPYAKYPELHRGRVAGYCPSLGNTADRLWDFTGNGNHGTMMPTFTTGPTWTVSEGKYANSFDGINDYVSANVVGSSPFAVSVWVNPTSLIGIVDFNHVCSHGYNGPKGWDLWIMYDGSVRLYIRKSGESSPSGRSTGTGLVVTNTWTHIFASFDTATGVRISVNGVDRSLTGSSNSNVEYADTVFRVANRVDQFAPWTGRLDDVQIFNRALSQNEITQLYQLGRGGSYAIDYEMTAAQIAAAQEYSRYLTLLGVG